MPIVGETYHFTGDVVDVRDVGAAGDGVTDDTAAIQRAIAIAAAGGATTVWLGPDDRAVKRRDIFSDADGVPSDAFPPEDARVRRVVYFPVGRYRVTAPLRITTRGVELRGPSRASWGVWGNDHGAVILGDHCCELIDVVVESRPTKDIVNSNWFAMAHLQLEPRIAAVRPRTGVRVQVGGDFGYDGLFFHDVRMRLLGGDAIRIEPAPGIEQALGANLVVTRCRIADNGGIGVHMVNGPANLTRIEHSQITGNQGGGVRLAGADVRIVGNRLEANVAPIFIPTTSTAVVIENNQFEQITIGRAVIDLRAVRDFRVAHNLVSNTTLTVVRAESCTKGTIDAAAELVYCHDVIAAEGHVVTASPEVAGSFAAVFHATRGPWQVGALVPRRKHRGAVAMIGDPMTIAGLDVPAIEFAASATAPSADFPLDEPVALDVDQVLVVALAIHFPDGPPPQVLVQVRGGGPIVYQWLIDRTDYLRVGETVLLNLATRRAKPAGGDDAIAITGVLVRPCGVTPEAGGFRAVRVSVPVCFIADGPLAYVNPLLLARSFIPLAAPCEVPTFAVLRRYTGYQAPSRVLVRGRHLPDDGGGGWFVWRTAPAAVDDDGIEIIPTVIPAALGHWHREFDGPVRPEWYGARADGVTNATAAVRACCSYLRSRGGRIAFAAGRYRFDERIVVPEAIELHGEGAHATVLEFAPGPGQIERAPSGLAFIDDRVPVGPSNSQFEPFVGELAVGGGVRGLAVVWRGLTKAPPALIEVRSRDDLALADLLVLGPAQFGVFIALSQYVHLDRVWISGAERAGLYIAGRVTAEVVETFEGLAPVPVGGLVTTCRATNCYFALTSGGHGADVAGTSLTFIGCVFEANAQTGLRVRTGTVTNLAGHFEANGGTGLAAGIDPATGTACGPGHVNAADAAVLVEAGSTFRGRATGAIGGPAIDLAHVYAGAVIGSDVAQLPGQLTLSPAAEPRVAVVGVQRATCVPTDP